jgi:hypothetical protein
MTAHAQLRCRPGAARPFVYSLTLAALAAMASACGGGSAAARTPGAGSPESKPSDSEVAQAQKPCGEADKVHTHDLNSEAATEALSPCSATGPRDYSALVKIQTIDDGVHIIIDATDDEVTILGPEVKERDAVIVYPKGKGSTAVEVPLMKTRTGYHGDKIVLWNDLGKLTDEGSKIDVAIYDHDRSSHSTEELHMSLVVSTGPSCEKAKEENMEHAGVGAPRHSGKDLTDDQLGAPMRDAAFFSRCGLADGSKADICVAIRRGRPVGVSVEVDPSNKRVASCIDRATRKLHFPSSDRLDVVHQKF